jgi:hypothetical protein
MPWQRAQLRAHTLCNADKVFRTLCNADEVCRDKQIHNMLDCMRFLPFYSRHIIKVAAIMLTFSLELHSTIPQIIFMLSIGLPTTDVSYCTYSVIIGNKTYLHIIPTPSEAIAFPQKVLKVRT